MQFRVLRFGIPASALALGFVLSVSAQQLSLPPDIYKNRLAPYVASPQQAIDRILDMANLKSGETLYDLGCGDGRILIAAAKRYKVKAVGIEISAHLARTAEERVRKAGLEDQVKVIHGDIMETDLSKADVVTLYLNNTANESLRPNLERHLRANTRVISYDYPISGWRPIATSDTEARNGAPVHTIYLYEVPGSIDKK